MIVTKRNRPRPRNTTSADIGILVLFVRGVPMSIRVASVREAHPDEVITFRSAAARLSELEARAAMMRRVAGLA